MMASTVFTAKRVFTQSEFRSNIFLEVGDGEIKAIKHQKPENTTIVDFGDAAIFLAINTHTHSHLSFLRGRLDGLEIGEWLKAVYQAVSTFGTDESYLAAVLTFAEAILSGTTTIADFFYINGSGNDNIRSVIKAATDIGIRLVMGRTFLDAEWGGVATRETVNIAVDRFRQLHQEYRDYKLVEIAPAPHSLVGASRDMIEAAYSLAQEYDSRWFMHVAYSEETGEGLNGERSIPLLDRWGVLDHRLVNVHAVWLTEEELDLLGQRSGLVSYCAASNMFFGERILDFRGLKRRGIKMGLGTDGSASNNTQDMFSEVRVAALCQRLASRRADAVTMDEMVELITSAGGEILGLPVGKLEPRYQADFIVIDTSDIALQPTCALTSHIIQSMTARAVRDVYVAGRPVVKDHQLLNLDLTDIIAKVNQLVPLQ
jgi:5-methylthioadenosine/S-adenosylhomocysteine deaminase